MDNRSNTYRFLFLIILCMILYYLYLCLNESRSTNEKVIKILNDIDKRFINKECVPIVTRKELSKRFDLTQDQSEVDISGLGNISAIDRNGVNMDESEEYTIEGSVLKLKIPSDGDEFIKVYYS